MRSKNSESQTDTNKNALTHTTPQDKVMFKNLTEKGFSNFKTGSFLGEFVANYLCMELFEFSVINLHLFIHTPLVLELKSENLHHK